MSKYDYDLFVIGGGSGGVRAARMSAGFGAKVGLAEESRLGGTCVNVGCVPKKLMVYASHYGEDIEDAAGYGWTTGGPARFDWATLMRNKDAEIARLNEVYGGILDRAGVTTYAARASVVGPHEVEVDGQRISAGEILVATGGRPLVPETPGAEHYDISDAIFELPAVPKRVVVVGGGYIGVELAGILNALGAEVHLVHKDEHLLNAFDDDVRTFLTEQIRLKGVHVHNERRVASLWLRDETKVAKLDDGTELLADLVLSAIGRRPNSRGFGLEEHGVELGARGAIVVDDDLRSTVPSIAALGDVIDRVALTPVALEEGMAYARHRFGGMPMAIDYENIPTAVFSNPEVATVGLGEAQAWHRGEVCEIYKSTFTPMKHSLSGRHEKSMMKLVICKRTDKVLGMHVVGPAAAEIMQGMAVAMKCGVTKAQLDATVGIHPTAAEELVTMRTPVASG
ncbi:MAG: glutathione-disulfide reductase [Deltaproteobacteria bacterium]|nr:glutathione-disulfide reductase [Deltaproteobacteria bacterium]